MARFHFGLTHDESGSPPQCPHTGENAVALAYGWSARQEARVRCAGKSTVLTWADYQFGNDLDSRDFRQAGLAWKYASGDGGNAGTSLRVSGRGSTPAEGSDGRVDPGQRGRTWRLDAAKGAISDKKP